MQIGTRRPRKKLRVLVVVVVMIVVACVAWLALRVGPAPEVVLDTERPAIGRAMMVTARFAEPTQGLGSIRLELVQGDRVEILAENQLIRGSLLPWSSDIGTTEATLSATVGFSAQGWLVEGDAVIRATADRSTGWLKPRDRVVVEDALPVRIQPPRLELLSSQHYGRQGGSGAVVYRVGETAVRSGVRAGDHVSPGSKPERGAPGDRFLLYALPWDLSDSTEVRLFAEDDAGNRVELPFLDGFIERALRVDQIRLTDRFLERVVPAIASQTPGFDAAGSLLDQYLVINGELRRSELDRVRQLGHASEQRFLWSGAFLQMANSARMAGFAEPRSYLYDGREVDRQTHLGLDLASTARAPVPAPNAGRVVFSGWMSLYGNAVVIDHGLGLLSLSGHLSAIHIGDGEHVERGQTIGSSGATGLAGGDHLHLEIFVHGQPVDPIEWLDPRWIEHNITSKLGRP
jgi:murein DD-endopeptidase MepM/ murein hydrolase activator NlpD